MWNAATVIYLNKHACRPCMHFERSQDLTKGTIYFLLSTTLANSFYDVDFRIHKIVILFPATSQMFGSCNNISTLNDIVALFRYLLLLLLHDVYPYSDAFFCCCCMMCILIQTPSFVVVA